MADEVIIEEYSTIEERYGIASIPLTTQVLDIATVSAALNPNTKYIRIRSNDTPLWYKFGASNVSAEANTDGNLFLPANACMEHSISPNLFIDTAADA